MDQLWTLVWVDRETKARGIIVPPSDCNPGSPDEGMLVYRSLEAAEASAEHQTELYGDAESEARPIRLDEVMDLLESGGASVSPFAKPFTNPRSGMGYAKS